MKPEEALENLKVAVNVYHEYGDHWNESDNEMDEAMKIAIQAIEKQIPKKPKKLSYEPLIRHGWEYECPECSKAIGINSVGFDFTDEDPFCPSCGQKVDWEESP